MFYTFVLKWVEMLLKSNEKEKNHEIQEIFKSRLHVKHLKCLFLWFAKTMRIVKIYRISQPSFLNETPGFNSCSKN